MKNWKRKCKQAGAGLLLFGLALSSSAAPPSKPEKSPVPASQEPISGVVVNQTITVAGQEFFRAFASGWRDMQASDRYVVSVHERPSARQGSQIWIEFAQRKVFQTVLPLIRSKIQAIGEEAVTVAYQTVVDADVQRMLFRDIDLAPDEI